MRLAGEPIQRRGNERFGFTRVVGSAPPRLDERGVSPSSEAAEASWVPLLAERQRGAPRKRRGEHGVEPSGKVRWSELVGVVLLFPEWRGRLGRVRGEHAEGFVVRHQKCLALTAKPGAIPVEQPGAESR